MQTTFSTDKKKKVSHLQQKLLEVDIVLKYKVVECESYTVQMGMFIA